MFLLTVFEIVSINTVQELGLGIGRYVSSVAAAGVTSSLRDSVFPGENWEIRIHA